MEAACSLVVTVVLVGVVLGLVEDVALGALYDEVVGGAGLVLVVRT